MEKTGLKPPVSIITDIATYQRRSRLFTSILTIVPDSEDLIQVIPMASHEIPSDGRSGRRLADQIVEQIGGIHPDQISSFCYDGAFVHERVGEHVGRLLNLDPGKVNYAYDAMHRGGRVDVNVSGKYPFIEDTCNIITSCHKMLVKCW